MAKILYNGTQIKLRKGQKLTLTCAEKYLASDIVVENNVNNKATEGLAYEFNNNKTTYICTGIGTATDTDIVIANEIDGLEVIGIKASAFEECTNLTSVVIGDNVTSIGSKAFYNCDSLTSVTIPNSVTTIGESAFYACTSLTSVTIGDSVTTIGVRAFGWCKNLTSIVVDKNNQSFKSIDENLYTKDGKMLIQYAIGKAETHFTIPDSVTTIGGRAFFGCGNLTSVTIPDSVTNIASYAFSDSSLTDVYYTGTAEQWVAIRIFSNNSYLTNATKHFNYVENEGGETV